MDIWQILGIEYTQDIGVIKKAYAKKLKVYHPEDDAQGYQMLREAYDQAIKVAKRSCTFNEPKFITQIEDEESSVVYLDSSFETQDALINYINLPGVEHNSFYHSQNDESQNDDIAKFIDIMDSIYRDFSARINTKTWIELLNHDLIWNLENRRALFLRILGFLSEHRNLPREIWALLDDTFHIQDQMNESIFTEYNSLRNFLVKVFNQKSMSFEYLANMEYEDRERFIELRIYALDSYQRKHFGDAIDYIEKAKSIFDGDPELIYIEGRYLYIHTQIDEAIKAFTNVLKYMPSYQEVLLSRADAYMRKDDFLNAKSDIEKLLELKPSDELIIYLAKIYIKLGQPIEARNMFKRINAYSGTPNENILQELLVTNKSILKMTKKLYKNSDLIKKSDIPLIRAELKRLKEYKKELEVSRSDSIDRKFTKVIMVLAFFFLAILISVIFPGTSSKKESNADIDKNLSERTLEMLSAPDKNTIIILDDLVVSDTFILKSTSGEVSDERFLSLDELKKIEEPKRNVDIIFIGREDKDYILFRGSYTFYESLVKYESEQGKELPSQITIRGKILGYHIEDLIPKMRVKESDTEKYNSFLSSVNADYVFYVNMITEGKN